MDIEERERRRRQWNRRVEADARRARMRTAYEPQTPRGDFSEARASIERRWQARDRPGYGTNQLREETEEYPLSSERTGFTGVDRAAYDRKGPHAGKGPRGYRRPDGRILEDVMERLTVDDRIDASDVEVEVIDGVVALYGQVESRGMKRLAENVSWSVSGVRDVRNGLRINGSFS